MTDYELYQILDEGGFEPSQANLTVLKEMLLAETDQDDIMDIVRDPFMSYEEKIKAIKHIKGEDDDDEPKGGSDAAGKKDNLEEGLLTLNAQLKGKSLAKNTAKAARINKALERDEARGGKMSGTKRAKLERKAAKAAEKVRTANDYMNDIAANGSQKKLTAMNAAAQAQEKKDSTINKSISTLQNKYGGGKDGTDKSKDAVAMSNYYANRSVGKGKKGGSNNYGTSASASEIGRQQYAKGGGDAGDNVVQRAINGGHKSLGTGKLTESIDIITSLLESNGFEVSDENVVTLCEGILSGDINVLDSSDVILTEGMDEDYIYMQLLDNNDFEVSENNINVLKEAIENGHILLA